MATKWFEVEIVAVQVYVVEVEDDQEVTEAELVGDAVDVVWDEAFPFIQQKETGKVTELKTAEEIERAKRHADEVIPLET